MPTTIHDLPHVYTRAGRRAHLLAPSQSPNDPDIPAFCRIWPERDGWLGTGSQDEWEKAASLPVCKDCLRVVLGAQYLP
jgi:hypothetical protein